MYIRRGRIESFVGSWGSGLGFLIINGEGIPCQNAPTIRALEAAFGNVIGDDHTASIPDEGLDVVWWDDGLVLEGFIVGSEWDDKIGIDIPDEGMEWNPEAASDDDDECDESYWEDAEYDHWASRRLPDEY